MQPSTRHLAAVAVVSWMFSLWAAPAVAQQATTLGYDSAASVGMDAALLDEAAQLYRDAVDRGDLKGAVLMVARRGVIVLHEAVGWRHEAYRLPMETDTLFPDGLEHQAGHRHRGADPAGGRPALARRPGGGASGVVRQLPVA